jgi:hypothetical protein
MSDYGPVTTQFDDNRVNEIKTPTLSAKPDGSTLTKARDPAPAEAQIPDRTSENTELLSNSGFKIGDKVTSPMPGEENIALTILSVHPNKQGEVILKNEKNNTKISCLISELLKAPTPVIEVNNSKSRDITPETIKDVEKFGINVEKLKMINSYGLKIVFTPA